MRRVGIFCVFALLFGLAHNFLISSALVTSVSAEDKNSLALVGAKIYPAPSEKPIENGVVLIRDGKITAVGEKGKIKLPSDATKVDCAGLTLTSGFWNSHVHFTELKWEQAATLPPAQLTGQLQDMFTRYGFTTVFDTGSYWEITKVIRQRVKSGEVNGPTIFSTGEILFPKDGAPPLDLVKASGSIARKMPEVESTPQAVELVRQKLASGVDGIKIYAQTFWNPNLKVPLEAVKAITAEAHKQGKPVFVHPSNSYGLEAAVEGGVDVLVHTTPQTGPWSDDLIAKMRKNNMALVPTLKLWRVELEREHVPPQGIQKFQDRGVNQLQAYFKAGGQILFGTDVGYIPDYDPTEEYQQMERAGMRFQDILASLTTAPAERFGEAKKTGKIAPGMDADMVLLAGDPANDIKALTNVKYTLRGGKIIFQAK